MLSLPNLLMQRCREILLKCDKFDTHENLQTIFIVQELAHYRYELPEAHNRGERVDKTITFLLSKDSIKKQPVFLLFLRTLRNFTLKEEELFTELDQLCTDIELAYFAERGPQDSTEHHLKVRGGGSTTGYPSQVELQKQRIASQLAQVRMGQPLPQQYRQKIKIDKDVIVSYDLDSQMARFREQLGYEGAFAFTIVGDTAILEQYVIERMMRELKSKTGRAYISFPVRLYANDLGAGKSAIEHKLIANQICDSLPKLFEDNPVVDVVLVVWNYDIPPGIMKSVASSFWEAIETQVTPCLKDQSRCFIVIWANVGHRKHVFNRATAIVVPTRFEVSELEQWFRGQLRQLGIEEEFIRRYLSRLKNQYGHIIGTFQEMQCIIHELQGGIVPYE